MKRKTAIATTISTAVSLRPSKVYVRRIRGRNLPLVHTVSEAGKRGGYIPPRGR